MKKIIDQNVCIRVDRDEIQINRCKERIALQQRSLQKMAQILSLSGNEVRLKILILLQEEEKLCVCDLSEILEMKIPAISQHLRKLKDANLVFTQRDGTIIFYRLSPPLQPILETILRLTPKTTQINLYEK